MENVGLFLVAGIVGLVACVIVIVIGLTWKPGPKTDKPKAPGKTTAASTLSTAATPVLEGGPREVLRVLRDAATEELFVEVAGQRYTRMADIRQASVREGLLTTLRDLAAFGGGAPAAARPAATNAGSATQTLNNPPPLPAPSMNPFKQMRVLRDLNKVQPPPVRTIAEQIDEILQEKLVGTPHRTRGIRVHAGPKGNALFGADGRDYEAVDSVPDDEVRLLIRAAVAEWEQHQ